MTFPSHEFLEELWYGKHYLSLMLSPIGWIYAVVMSVRRLIYASGILPVREVPVPVIVVGNITVGGTGKTPLIIWLANFLQASGYHPGIISHGYGGKTKKWPQQARSDSSPFLIGDEPVLIAQRTTCPVAVSPDRYIAARELVEHTDCDILLCDDGLQHLALNRDIEIAVIDGDRRFGNKRCLPAGPLRESINRLNSVDMVVANARAGKNEFLMEYTPQHLRAVADDKVEMEIGALHGQTVHAVAGIGNPGRFFSYLRANEIRIIKHKFPDHYQYKMEDLRFNDNLPVVMTEKDAVKCREFNVPALWYLPIEAKMSTAFEYRLINLLKEIFNGQKAA